MKEMTVIEVSTSGYKISIIYYCEPGEKLPKTKHPNGYWQVTKTLHLKPSTLSAVGYPLEYAELFFEKVEEDYKIGPEIDFFCAYWRGVISDNGYKNRGTYTFLTRPEAKKFLEERYMMVPSGL